MDNGLRNSQILISIFLQLVADYVKDVNKVVDYENMIKFGMILGVDGIWTVNQLFFHFQQFIAKYEPYFHDQHVPL